MRILLLAESGGLPRNTGSGLRLIKWGLISGLISNGCEVGLVYFDWKSSRLEHQEERKEAEILLKQINCHLFYFKEEDFLLRKQITANIIKEYKPDVIFGFGSEILDLTSMESTTCITVINCIDLLFLPDLYRFANNIYYGSLKTKLKTFFMLANVLLSAAKNYRCVMNYKKADFIVCHAYNHTQWLRRKLNIPCLYTPNPLTSISNGNLSVKPDVGSSSRFLLVGGLNGIATLSGLYYFANNILPFLRKHIDKKEIEIVIIGRGTLEYSLGKKLQRAGVVMRGFVQSLEEEFHKATAMIVPTPIKLGFRTRILDAFRNRLCVIAHIANAAGMPELKHNENCLLARDGKELASYLMLLSKDNLLRKRLVEQAHFDFRTKLHSDIICKKILSFLNNGT